MENINSKLAMSKLHVDALRRSLVSRTDPASISFISKIPHKALDIRGALLYRTTDLAEAACMLFEKENLISAACVTRAFQETLAALFYSNRKVRKTIENHDVQHLDEVLMKTLVGARNNAELPDSINILTMINSVNKEIPNFRAVYDNLSEFSHPNWAGTLGTYAKNNKEKMWTDFGRDISLSEATKGQGINALLAGLELIELIYDQFAEMLPKLVEICENKINSNSTT
jgi:hypothetical protein